MCLSEDVVAYVDVWSASRMEDYKDPFIRQLQDMGAEVRMLFILCPFVKFEYVRNLKSDNIDHFK